MIGARQRLLWKEDASRVLRWSNTMRLLVILHIIMPLKRQGVISAERTILWSRWVLGREMADAFNEQFRWHVPGVDLFEPEE